jgi:uncharacterized membrane protein (DUF485 family)
MDYKSMEKLNSKVQPRHISRHPGIVKAVPVNPGLITGAVVAVIVVLIAVIISGIFCYKKRKARRTPQPVREKKRT